MKSAICLLGAAWVTFVACEPQRKSAPTFLVASSLQPLVEHILTLPDAPFQGEGSIPKLVVASSSVLSKQTRHGMRADLFFSADLEWALNAQDGQTNRRSQPILWAEDSLSLVVRRDVRSGQNFGTQVRRSRLGLGDPELAPLGRYTKELMNHDGFEQVLRDSGLDSKTSVHARNAGHLLRMLTLGVVDGAILYTSFAKGVSDVEVKRTFSEREHLRAQYWMMKLSEGNRAQTWWSFFTSRRVGLVLQSRGYQFVSDTQASPRNG